MKRVLFALAMSGVGLFCAPAAVAATGGDNDFFAEAKLGNASIWDQGTQGSTPELLAGYRWNTDFGKLGFELGRVNFGVIDSGEPSNGFGLFGATFKGHAIKAGVDLNYTFAERMYLEPRAGLMRLSYTGVQRDWPNPNTNYNETKAGHYVGIGLGVWIMPSFAVSLNFDNYTAEMLGQTRTIRVTSIGAQFRF